MTLVFFATLMSRYLLVVLFFPFSALDKILDFKGALRQAQETFPGIIGIGLLFLGFVVEIIMPLGILTGVADRAAAFVLSGYCIVTALLWKQFWKMGDFWVGTKSQGRLLFWDFLKNLSLAGGFLLLVAGTSETLTTFFDHPFASSHPYVERSAP